MPLSVREWLAPFKALVSHRALLWQLLRREFVSRYRGSLIGLGYALLLPLLTLSAYAFLFFAVFKIRWASEESLNGPSTALRIFAGIIVYQFFCEVLTKSPTSITNEPNLVKKVVFPLELLPAVGVAAAMTNMAVSLVLLIAATLVFEPRLEMNVWMLPMFLVPLLPLLLGISWLLSALGVFVRDIPVFMIPLTTVLMLLSPVFYSVDALDKGWQSWVRLNPLTSAIETLRNSLFLGLPPDWTVWCSGLILGIAVALAGAFVFQAVRRGFADVM